MIKSFSSVDLLVLSFFFSETRFFGYNSETKYNAEAHRDRILGKHVADYMTLLKEQDEDAYKRHFSRFIAANINADEVSYCKILYRSPKYSCN